MEIPKLITKAEGLAIKALNDGVANERQQKLAIIAIINGLSAFQNTSFDPDNPHQTSFNEGRRFVGTMMKKAILFDWDSYETKKTTKPKHLLTTK
jgi:hypothetical protein